MTVRSQNVRMDTEVGGSWEGKRCEGWEKGYKKRKNEESVHLHEWNVTKFHTNSCVFGYE